MQIIIDIDDEDYDDITLTGENTINLGVLLDLREAVRNGIPLPKGATNGDVIKAMFPNAEISYGLNGIIGVKFIHMKVFDSDWWNVPYIEADRSEKE